MLPTSRPLPSRTLTAALLTTLLLACQPAASPPTFGGLSISTAVVVPDIVRVSATLSGPTLPQIVYDLGQSADGTWSATIPGLPPAAIHVQVAAFDAAGALRFAGAGDVTVTAGVIATLEIFAQEVSPPPSYGNTPPHIDAIGVSALTVAPSASLTFNVTASDPDAGALLSYLWTAPGGSFSAPSAPATSWIAPPTPGTQTITVRVSDEKGTSMTATFDVTVADAPPTTGAIALSVQLNRAPVITDIDLSETRVLQGVATTLTGTALDADGDALSFAWTSTCPGTFGTPASPTTTFTPATTTPDGLCTLYLRAADGRGGIATGWTGLWVGPPPPVGGQPPLPPPSFGIVNGDFETGDYTGWFAGSSGTTPGRHAWGLGQPGMMIFPGMPVHDFETGGDVFFTDAPYLPLPVDPAEGQFGAFLVAELPGVFGLAQYVTVPPLATVTLQVAYGAEQPWAPGVQELRVVVETPDGLVLAVPFRTGFEPPVSPGWTWIDVPLDAWAGQDVFIGVVVQSQVGPVWAKIDGMRLL